MIYYKKYIFTLQKMIPFLIGFVTGIYVDQHYKLPRLDYAIQIIQKELKSLELKSPNQKE